MNRLYFVRLVILLCLAVGAKIILAFEIPTSTLIGGILVGAGFSFILRKRHLSFLGFIFSHACIAGIYWVATRTLPFIVGVFTSSVFLFDLWSDSCLVFLLLASLISILSWFFLRLPGYPAVELVGIIGVVLSLFGGHRNYNFDNPKILSDLAWQYSLEPLTLLVGAGFVLSVGILAYSVLIAKWELAMRPSITIKGGSQRRTARSLGIAVIAIALAMLGSGVFRFYFQQQQLQSSNGVGQASEAGLSPLGFNSAMGSTNQPAAVVRLDGDYTENPFQPMIYLRENALSTMTENELVIAGAEYDTDLHRTSPTEHFEIDQPIADNRKKLSFSAYLLTNHNLSFAIDYPISISPIKNPQPEKFKGAFHAISLVPTFKIQDLQGAKAGERSWSKETTDHYLAPHKDPRYAELAARIIGNTPMNAADAADAIAKYLSANSIYTLTPNHSSKKGEDQVAPYLFGDMRGYCVHFAHATVFMLRSLGIPARIGTGYLTDLSKAKDGHLLLRMSDRHAWAEVYFEGFGWIPFDTKPTKVESHANGDMDYKLLEELMGMLGNDEFLPKEEELKEPGLEQPKPFELPITAIPWMDISISILLGLIMLKSWVRWSWRLPGSQKTRLFRAYRSLYSVVFDLGLSRHKGETYLEFQKRLASELPDHPLSRISIPAIKAKLSSQSFITSAEIARLMKEERSSFRSISFSKRCIVFLNPSSCILAFRRQWS